MFTYKNLLYATDSHDTLVLRGQKSKVNVMGPASPNAKKEREIGSYT